MAVDFDFHGDFNNRFGLYTNQQGFFVSDQKGVIADKDREDSFASIKYRLWTEASTNDGAVKGVYAIEIGAVRFGRSGVAAKVWAGGFPGMVSTSRHAGHIQIFKSRVSTAKRGLESVCSRLRSIVLSGMKQPPV